MRSNPVPWRRLALWGGAALVVLLLGGTVVSSWVWGQMLRPTCIEVPRADLTLQQMVDVKLLVDESQRSGSSELVFSGPEASFLLREVLRLPVHVEVEGPRARVLAAIPYREQCYNVAFDGVVSVLGHEAEVAPESFVVGELELKGWVHGLLDLRRVAWVSTEASAALAHIERLEFRDGQVIVKVDDVAALR